MPLRRLLPVLVLAFLGCGASPGEVEPAAPTTPVSPQSTAAPGASSKPVVAIALEPGDRPASSAVSSSAPTPAPSPPSAASSVSASATASAAPASAPLTDGEKKIADMCLGKTSKFTEKEEKLLRLAESSGRADLKEQAAMLREARESTLKQACDRLRAEGKL